MATTNTVTINEIPVDPLDPTKTAWGSKLSTQYYFVIANGTAAGETFDAADISGATKTLMATYGRGVAVNMGAGDDTVTGSGYGDSINAGEGTNYIDGGANQGATPGGAKARDVLNVFAASQAAADALSVTAIDAAATGADGEAYAAGYRIKVSNGTETDYLKNVEQVNVFLAGTNTYVKTIRLAVDVFEIDAAQVTDNAMHMAWAQGTGFADTFSAATDLSGAAQALMAEKGRGVWVDTGAGDDTVTGSGYGDDINAGSGTNYVDGGANAGSPPWGGKAMDVLHVTVASQEAADAVAVVQLSASSTGLDGQAFANGYTHKVTAGADTDYIKGIERVSVEIKTGNGSSWARDIPLAVVVHEANLADSANNYHLAWVNGTAGADTIDLSGDSALLSAELKAAMAARGRGVWVDGGAGNDIITGTAYADNFRNGAGNAKIDGGANAGPNGAKGQDVFEITVASTADMNAIQVVASDDSAYTWMVTYGAGSTQKDYLKNIEAIVVNVAGTSTGKWIPLAVNVHEISGSADLDKSMHFAWAQGTAQDDSFNAGTDVSAATRTLMDQKGRGVWVDLGAGNDTAVGSGYGDDFSMGAGTNYVDGGANAGSPPWGGNAADVLHVTVASQAAADAVTVTALGAGLTGLDAQAFTNGYTHKVMAGGEIDYIKGIERVSVQVDNGNGGISWARDIALAVVVHEANLADSNIGNYYHLGWVNGTAGADAIDLSGDSALLSAELKAAMAARGRGVWVDGGAGNDTITGTAYADNFRNGAGNAKIDGGANAGPNGAKGQDVFEITVASTADMNAIQVVASDDSAYTWMVTYGAGSTQKDYLKNIEAIVVNVAGTSTGKWIPLAVNVHEISGSADLDKSMHFAWAQGTAQDDSFNAGTDVSAATRTLMDQKGRGVWVDLGAGNDTAVGSGYGDDFSMGAGTNYVDGGANAGSPPWGGKAADVLRVTVASQAAADAVTVTALGAGLTGLDAQAFTNGYTHKVVAGGEIDYIKGIERVSIQVDTGNGSFTWARDVPLAVVVQEANLADSNIGNYYHLGWVNGTAGADAIDLSGDSALLSAELKAAMAARGRGLWVDGGTGNDTITGTAYADNFRNGAGNAKIDGGANAGPNGAKGQDVFEITVASTADMNAIQVVASDDSAYTWMVTYGAGSTQKDYLKNIEAIVVNVAGTSTGKWIPLAVNVHEIAGSADLDKSMHFAWAQGTAQDDSFNAGTDVSAATRTLMDQKGRGVWVDLGAGNDTAVGSGYGDDFSMGAGTNYVDGGANAGSPPFGGKATDVLHVTVASQAAADAVTVTALGAGLTGADAQAFTNGYTHKVVAGNEIDYIKGIERVSIQIDTGNGSSTWVRDVPLAVIVQEANLADSNSANYSHLAWVNGTAGADTIDLSGDSALLSAEIKAAMAARGRGAWVNGGGGNDTITGTGYADNFYNGAGNSKIDGGANAGPNGATGSDLFEIKVATTEELNAIQVVASDDPAYTWMVTYGAGSTQKDYLKNIEAVVASGPNGDRFFRLAINVNEIGAGADLDKAMHYAWVSGTPRDDSFNAATDISAATRELMGQHGRGVWVELGAGNDSATGSGYGDDFSMGAGTNYVDGGANAGSPPNGGKAADVLHVTVTSQAAADAVKVTGLVSGMTGADAQAFANGYTHKVVSGSETDYVKNIERVAVEIDNGNGTFTFARDITLVVTVYEADLASPDIDKFYTLATVKGTADADTIDLSGDTALLSAPLKAAMAARGRGVYVEGGAGNDVITGSAYADEFQNGAGNAKIDGGANAGPGGLRGQDVFRITAATVAEMDAIRVVQSDDANYTWMVTYGAGSTQKDYLKNIEAVSINVPGATSGKWIPLALNIHEIEGGADLANIMHFAWADGTGADETFNANTDLSSATRTRMAEYGRGIRADMGAGNDTVVGSAYGDNIVVGAGTNYVDGGANNGVPPGGGIAQDVLEVYVADQTAADALTVTELTAAMTGADGEAYAAGYRVKVTNGTTEVDYLRGIERIQVGIWNDKNGDGQRQYYDQSNPANEVTWVRSVTPPASAPTTPNTAPTFGGVPAGVAVTDAGRDFGAVGGTVLASGKLLSLSYLRPDSGEYVLVLNRSNADGSVDTTFGSGGRVMVPTSYNNVAAPVEVAGGKVLVGVSTFGAAADFRVLRLNADGSLDTTFGTGGYTTVSMGTGADQVRKLVVDGSGKIVLVGNAESSTGRDMAVVRLTADGAPDTSFNGSGKATVSLAAGINMATTAVAQADGKLVVVGYAPTGTAGVNQVAAVRMNSDGSLDTTFGSGGKVLLPLAAGTSYASSIQLLADGRILLGGSFRAAATADLDPALVMLTASGALDQAFGIGGIAKAHPSDMNDTVNAIQVQADGKIVILGALHYNASSLNGSLLVARYNANGTPDYAFGDNGGVVVSVHGIGDQPASLALVDGKIVVFGSAINDTNYNTSNIIVRLNGDGTPDTSFGAANPSSLGGTVRAGMLGAYLDQNAAVYDAELAARGNYGGAALTLARQGGANAEDLFIGAGEVRLVDGNITVAGIVVGSAVQAGGKLDILFNEQATQGLVNRALHGLVYLNTSATPPASVVVDWTFSDNNNGSQGTGGALSTKGSTTVEIGIVANEVRKSLADPTLTAEHTPLANVQFVGNVFGTNAADTFDSATGFSVDARALMDQLQRGSRFETGAGNDTVTGTAYSDEFTLGAGVNRVDGGGQAGSHPYGGAGRDVLQVFVANDADGAAVKVTSLDASATGADKEAFDAGYNVKVVSGSETDYAKNIESVAVLKWVDTNGNKLRDASEVTWVRDFSLVLRVNEVQVSSSDPTRDTGGHLLSGNMHMAWAYGWNFADNFNADTNVSSATKALMAQYGRGVFVDAGAGDDVVVGSAYGDNIIAGTGVNRVDGGANGGTNPFGGEPMDSLEVYTDKPADVKVTALTSGMTGADADAYAAGYTYKVFAGAEIDYIKNIEVVTVFSWTDANNNGVRDGNEMAWHHRIPLTMMVDEIHISATDPTSTTSGEPLSNYGHYAWVWGSSGADTFSVEANVSAATRAAMAVSGRGVYGSTGAGDDVLSGSNWSDHFTPGTGTNKVDGGAGKDTVQMFVADKATADAVTITALTSSMTGADGQAYAEGYRYRIANGTAEVNYVKNVENVDIAIWDDKNGNGQQDYGDNEVSFGRWESLVPNAAPSFSGQPGVSVMDAGTDMTPYGFTMVAGGKMVSLSIVNGVAEGTNYTSVLARHNPDGSLDTSFGDNGMVWLPVTFGVPGRPVALADGKLLIQMSTSLSSTADFKVVRLNANGTVDTTFGANGQVVVSLTDGNDVPKSMLVQADGKILVSGGAGGASDFGVVRLNADGSLDTSYNGTGKLVLPLTANADSATSAVLQADGKLLVAGYAAGATNRDFAVVRIGTDGKLDASFGDGGKTILPVGAGTDVASAVVVQADGKIVLGGTARSSADATADIDLALVRLNANGSLDTTFGTGGKVVLHQSADSDGISDLLVQADGKIIASGWTGANGPAPALTVMRFNPDGTLDTMFGEQGVASAPVHAMGGSPVGLALVDGKIVVGAGSYFNTNFDASLVLMRLNMDGTFDSSFGGGSTLGGIVKSDGLHPVILDRNVSLFDAEFAEFNNYGGSTVTLARHGGANAEDVFSAAGEVRFDGGRLKVDGIDIGSVEQSGGTLTLHIGYAGQGMLERALHGIAYANTSSSPAGSVVIDWTFRENEGSGALSATGSTTVQIGPVVAHEAARSYVDPAKAADGRVLAEIPYLATVFGTAGGDTVSSGLVSNGGRALMDELKRGVLFETGAGNDVVTGSAYGDLFIAGAGTNKIDGGTNLGTDPAGAAALDILDVFVGSSAAAAGVAPVALTASMSGDDLAAFNAGYTHKVVAGGEIDYLKGIESVRVWVWDDKDGDGVRDVSSDAAVNEVTLVGTQAIPPSGV